MANIDELQIEISASNAKVLTAIRGLKQSLQSLSSALNIKAADSLISSLGNLSGSLDNLNSSIRNLDTGKLKEISSAIGSLSRSGSKLSQAGNSFGVLQKGATGAAKAIEKVDNAYSNETPERLASWIQQGEVEIERLRGQAEALRSILGSNRRIPKDFYSTAGDDAKSLIGYMGIKNTSYGGGEDMQELAEQFRQITGSTLPDNYTDAFIEIGERIRECVQQAEDFERVGYEMSAALESMQNNPIDEIADSFQRIETVTSSNPFEPLVESLERLQGINLSSGQLSGITTLAESMGRLGGKASATAASSLQGIAEGLRAFQGLQIPQLEGIDVLSKNLRSLGSGQGLTKAANALPFVAEGLRSLQGIHFDNVENIEGLAHAISRFGLSNAQKAISTLPQMADSFRRFAASMATVPQVSQNTIDLANAMANLAQQGGKAGVAANTLHPKIKRLGSTMKSTATHGKSLAAVIGKIYATYWLLFRAFGKLKNAIDFSADLTEVQNVVNHTFGEMTNKVEDFADIAIQKFGMSELQAKKTASRFQAMGVAMGIAGDQVKKATANFGAFNDVLSAADYNGAADSMADMSLNLTKLSADFASFYNMDIDEVSQKMEAVFTGMTRPLREFGLDLTQATLQEWALKNGIEANMKTMSQAEKTMLRYQYVMSNAGAAVGDFARTMNTWANVVRTIGQQFQKLGGLIGTGLINTFKPVLIRMRDFLNTLIGLVEKALNAIGKLLGWQIEIEEVGVTFDDAVDGIDDIADGTGRAADNAERMNKAIRGWDKLNVLNSKDSGGGSGGGGGGASGGGGGMSKSSGGAISYKNYESDINSWNELGQRIADKISEGLEGINWSETYEKFRAFGDGLAEFMNGLFTGESGKRLFGNLGATVAGAINSVFTAADAFAGKFDFKGLGESIGTGINKFFEKWKPRLTARTFRKFAEGILDTIISALDTVKWDKVGEAIGKFLANLKWSKVLKKMKTAIEKAIAALFTTLKFTFKEAPLETAIIAGFALLKFTGLGAKLGKMISAKLFGEAGIIPLVANGVKLSIKDGATALLTAIAAGLGVPVAAVAGGALLATVLLTISVAYLFDKLTVSDAELREALGGDVWDEMTEKADDYADSIEGLNTSLEDLQKEYETSLASADADARRINQLVERYDELSSKTSLTAEEKKQLNTVTQELMDKVPQLAQYFNEETGQIDLTKDAIKEMAAAEIEEIKTAAKMEYLNSLYEKRYEAVDELRRGYKLLKEAEEYQVTQMAELQKQLHNGEIDLNSYNDSVNELQQHTLESRDRFLECKNSVDEYSERINNLTMELDGTSENFNAVNEAFGTFNETALDANIKLAAANGELDDFNKKQKTFQNETKKSTDKTKDFKGNVDKATKSLKDVKKESNMSSSTQNIGIWSSKAKEDAYKAQKGLDDVTNSLNAVKTTSEMSGATNNIQRFTDSTSTNASNAASNIDKVTDSITGVKNNSDLSGAQGNIGTFASSVSGDMNYTSRQVSDTSRSIGDLTSETSNLMRKSGQTFEVKTNKTGIDNFKDSIGKLVDKLSDLFKYNNKNLHINTSGGNTSKRAEGGAFYKGQWHKISQFAGGGVPSYGSMFIAGERGAEMVGHINGRTEVLNESQLASVMYSAVSNAMSSQNAYLKQQNQLLSGILAKEFSVSSRDVFSAVQGEARSYTRRTGNTAF